MRIPISLSTSKGITAMQIALIVTLIIIAVIFVNACTGGRKLLDAAMVKEKVSQGALLLDVRTPGEFSRGHVENAENIPLQSLAGQIDSLPKERDIILYCFSGHRSAQAYTMLRKSGLERVFNAGSLARISGILTGK